MSAISTAELRRRDAFCRIIAHRGHSSGFPENTLEAYEAAISAGADLVEMDLRLSKDRIIVCHHDPATADNAEISDQPVDALTKRGVAVLTEILPKLRNRVRILVDIKIADCDLARDVIAILRRHEMAEQVVIGVRSVEQAEAAREASSRSVLLGFLKEYSAFPAFFGAGGDIARLWEEDCNADRISAARCGDHPVWVTSGGKNMDDRPGDIDGRRLQTLFDLGVDGVLVNDPSMAMEVRLGQVIRSEVG